MCLFQPQGLAHHSGLFVCHQRVSGVLISTTRPGSPFWPLSVPSGCKWCAHFNHKAGSPFWPLCVPSACKWCAHFNHKAWLTLLASLCAISMYVVCSFQPQGLAHHSGLFVCHQQVSGVLISTTRPGSPFWPLVCHQGVSGVYISTTRPGSPFWALCVPSACKWCAHFNHKAWLTILASLCAIRE